jgi:hypothetical protein
MLRWKCLSATHATGSGWPSVDVMFLMPAIIGCTFANTWGLSPCFSQVATEV